MTVAAFMLCHVLLESRIGLLLARDPRGPRLPRERSASTSSATRCTRWSFPPAMTSLAGVFFAFYYNNLFPEQVFHISRSIELILGPIIGGIGTLFGPLVGAFLLTALAEGMREVMLQLGVDVPGVKQVFYGVCLLLVVMFLPDGVWPPLSRRSDSTASPTTRRELTWQPSSKFKGISKSFSGLRAVQNVSFAVPEGEIVGLIGPNGAGKTTCFNLIAGVFRPTRASSALPASASTAWRPDQICRAGLGRTFQLVKPFADLTVIDNVIVGALTRAAPCARRASSRVT